MSVKALSVLLNALFRGEGPLACSDAGDANDDGVLSLTDAVAFLSRISLQGRLKIQSTLSAGGKSSFQRRSTRSTTSGVMVSGSG